MQFFVSTGKLSLSLADQVKAGREEVEVMVILNVDDIRANAKAWRKATGQRVNDAAILAEKRREYKSRKNWVFSRLPWGDYSIENEYENLAVVHMTVNRNGLQRLLRMAEVAAVQENGKNFMSLAESLPLINAPDTHSGGYTGSTTTVAVLDTGVDYTHAAFGSCTAPGVPSSCKVAYVQDFAPDDGSLDDDGHGTNVSGAVVGVAPDANILGLDVFREDGAWDSDIAAAINWVIAEKDNYNIVAVNLSLGDGVKYTSECPGDSLADNITDLKAAGISSVIASGNETYINGLASPACAPDGISVGAVYDSDVGGISYGIVCSDAATAADLVTCFSNSASFLTMLAPGAAITAADITMYGTSQAAPHVAGAVAVLKANEPGLNVDELITRLTGTGVSVTDSRNSIVKPRLNLYNAVYSGPLIGFSPADLSFSEIEGGTLPPGKTLTVRNDGDGTMSWSISADQMWLDLTPTSGVDGGSVTVSVNSNSSSLSPGSYNASITISSAQAVNSPRTVPVSLTVFDPAYSEDFESGNLNNLPWETSGDATWNVQGSTVYGGSYSAESGGVGDGEDSILSVSLNLTESGYVYFRLKTFTELSWDKLIFRVDGHSSYGKWNGWYGDNDWTLEVSSLEVAAGVHQFSWGYENGADGEASGTDKVWLDEIVFPAFNENVQNIEISPASHDFGNVAVATSSAVQTFNVSNSGTNDLSISSVTIVGADESQYSISSETCASQVLAPAAGCVVDVVFSPSSTGAKIADLRIISDDPDSELLYATLDGTGLTPFTLTVSKDGSGNGDVTSSPAGIDCGTDCSETYLDGEMVTLSDAADGESSFGGWSGGGCSGTGDCVLTITELTEVTASFVKYPPVADFSGSPLSGNAPLIVDFFDASTNSPTSWAWDFGDTGTSIDQNPTHVYQVDGTYSASLIATNAGGSDGEGKTGYISVGLCPNQPVRVGVDYYDTIQAGYDVALDGETIETHIASFTEDLLLDKNIAITFSQGYNCEYDAQASGTTIDGSLTISAGSLVVEDLTIR